MWIGELKVLHQLQDSDSILLRRIQQMDLDFKEIRKDMVLKVKKKREWSRVIYACIYLFMSIFFLYGLTLTNSSKVTVSILMSLEKQGYVLFFVWGYICAFLILFKMRKKIFNLPQKDLILFLILLAACPRIFVMCQNHYIPTNDFERYYEVGVHFIEGDKALVNNFLAAYSISKFGGLVVFMGIIAKLFSVKLIGFQVANTVITSLICVFIYLIIENYNKRVAIIAGILFAIYPENIISTQVTTNHHGAILFTLISIFCLIKVIKEKQRNRYFMCFVSGVALAISDFIHPSIIVPIVAILCCGILGGGKESRYLRFKSCLLAIFCYVIAINLGLTMLKAGGVLNNNMNISQSLPIGKIIVGFNYETRGMWSKEDYTTNGNLSGEEKRQWQKEQLEERIFKKPIKDILSLLRDKIDTVWFVRGSYFYWYWDGWHQHILSDQDSGGILNEDLNRELEKLSIYSSYQLFDWIFVKIIYIFAILGLFLFLINRKQDVSIELVAWMLLGWILIHLLIEVQERYRYLGMPYIFIFAGIGMYESYRRLMLFNKIKKRKRSMVKVE